MTPPPARRTLAVAARAARGGRRGRVRRRLAACGDDDDAADAASAVTLRLLTHDSFAVSDDVLAAFTEETGIEVEVIQGGDAGTVVNQAILTKGNPQADVLFGIDSTLPHPGARRGPLRALRGAGPRRRSTPRYVLDAEHRVTPIDYGDVCLNYDKAWFAEHPDVPVPDVARGPRRPGLQGPARGREPGHVVARPRLPARHRRPLRRGRLAGVVDGACGPTASRWPTAGRTPTTARSPAAAPARATARSSCRTRRARRPRWCSPTRPSTRRRPA